MVGWSWLGAAKQERHIRGRRIRAAGRICLIRDMWKDKIQLGFIFLPWFNISILQQHHHIQKLQALWGLLRQLVLQWGRMASKGDKQLKRYLFVQVTCRVLQVVWGGLHLGWYFGAWSFLRRNNWRLIGFCLVAIDDIKKSQSSIVVTLFF